MIPQSFILIHINPQLYEMIRFWLVLNLSRHLKYQDHLLYLPFFRKSIEHCEIRHLTDPNSSFKNLIRL